MVSVILTGGTISMHPTPQGLAPADGVVEAFLEQERPRWSFTVRDERMQPYVDSSHMDVAFWSRLLHKVRTALQTHPDEGVVVVMGTDTMSYVASALAMALGNTTAPVVVTGAYRPLLMKGPGGVGESDGAESLRTAVTLAGARASTKRGVPCGGVWVLMHRQLFPAVRVTKQGSQHRTHSGFLCPHLQDHIAAQDLGWDVGEAPLTVWRLPTEQAPTEQAPTGQTPAETLSADTARPHDFVELNVVTLTLTPGLQGRSLWGWQGEHAPDVVIVRCFGGMNGPPSGSSVIQALAHVRHAQGALVIGMSQGLHGVAVAGAYAAGNALVHEVGAIAAGDQTLEALVTKLHWRAHAHRRVGDRRTALERDVARNLRGELTLPTH